MHEVYNILKRSKYCRVITANFVPFIPPQKNNFLFLTVFFPLQRSVTFNDEYWDFPGPLKLMSD